MNKRIEELIEQAQMDGDNIHYYSPAFAEKFAELIVKECAGIVQTYMSRWPEDAELTKQIKEHFGVEEK